MFGFGTKRSFGERCKKGDLPEVVCEYLRKNRSNRNVDLSTDAVRFVVLDTEATGLDPKKDVLLSIGAVAISGGAIWAGDSFEGVFRTDREVARETVHIHGILPSESANGMHEEAILQAFLHYLGDSIFVAHNARFDRSILGEYLERLWGFRIKNQVLDTMLLARRLGSSIVSEDFFQAGDFSLDALATEHGIDLCHRHQAWGDALITARLLLVLLQRAKQRGIGTLRELLRAPGSGLL